ncbi:kunitz-type serine protease inhibitor bitisilin-3-like [Pecten maximus]|uniref:kunitz-type serine protease inhibitor bitisilin-3-like n=1 Tax=Pecten maximus TaxID=6579 RepID=UPI0014590D5F|nr:kunitz-type serine protease inhibitor bitisilin-3-like [Pecten maximus]
MTSSRILLVLFAFMLLMATIEARRRQRKCRLPPHPGRPCGFQNFRVQRFYYDRQSGRCKSFIYYGCGGNENRFRTRRACRRTSLAVSTSTAVERCLSDSEMKTFAVALISVMMLSMMQGTSARRLDCLLPPVAGHGNLAITRFYWDTAASRCRTFTYNGRGGNRNRFATRAACRADCRN